MKRKRIILCVQNKALHDAPGHLQFGVNYLKEASEAYFDGSAEVKFLYFEQKGYSKLRGLVLNIILAWKILTVKHDAVYYGTDPNNLFLLCVLKNMGIYKKKMFAWKYIALYPSKKRIVTWVKKKFYSSFERIFMVTERHVKESIDCGLATYKKCCHIRWGADIDYVGRIKAISTPPNWE